MNIEPCAVRIVSAWLAYTQVEPVASLDDAQQEALRAKFRTLIEQTMGVLEGVPLNPPTRAILVDFSRLLLTITEQHRAWWSYPLLLCEIKKHGMLARYKPFLPALFAEGEPAPGNALYWARELRRRYEHARCP